MWQTDQDLIIVFFTFNVKFIFGIGNTVPVLSPFFTPEDLDVRSCVNKKLFLDPILVLFFG